MCIRYLGKPEPPSAPHAMTSNRTYCELSWEPPNFDGGAAISGYHIEFLCYGTEWSRMTGGLIIGTQFCTRKLEESVGYHFRVIAANKFGESPPGPVSEVIETIGTAKLATAVYIRNAVYIPNF